MYADARDTEQTAVPTSEWERPHQVEVTFKDKDSVFWAYDGETWKELPSELVIWAEATRAKALRELIEDGFVPGYGVTTTVRDFTRIEDLQRAFKAVQAGTWSEAIPDVLVGPHDWLGHVLKERSIQPVHLTRSDAESFHPKAIAALSRGHRLYGIPYVFDSVALIRNTRLAGLGPWPETFEELIAHGEQLRERGLVEHPVALQVGDTGDPYHLWPLFSSVGGSLFGLRYGDEVDEPDVWRAGFVAAFERLAELGEAGRGVLRRDIGRAEALPMFLEGRTPYLVCSSRALASLVDSPVNFDVGAVPPFGPSPAVAMVSVYGFFINPSGANTRIAEDLVTHILARKDTGQRLVEIQPRPPVQLDADTDPVVTPYVEQCTNGVLMPQHEKMRDIWDLLGRAQSAVIGGSDPRSVAEQAADRGWDLIRRRKRT